MAAGRFSHEPLGVGLDDEYAHAYRAGHPQSPGHTHIANTRSWFVGFFGRHSPSWPASIGQLDAEERPRPFGPTEPGKDRLAEDQVTVLDRETIPKGG